MNKILPLPVKKNKFGERVANIGVKKYYRQMCEEVLEAHSEVIYKDREAEELVDVITCCITRLDILNWSKDTEDFIEYVTKVIERAKYYYDEPKDFYVDLSAAVMRSYHAAEFGIAFDDLCSDCTRVFSEEFDEEDVLGEIISMCIKRLAKLGYNDLERQAIYQAVNEKNRKRGYFEE